MATAKLRNPPKKPKEPQIRGAKRTCIEDLPEDWEEKIRELAQNGAGRVEWQCALGIHNTAYLTLLQDSAHFREVIAQAKLLSQAWWECLGRRGAAGQVEINASVWALNMKNRFRWREATVAEARSTTAIAGQPKTLVRTILPPAKFDTPADEGVTE